MTRIAARLAAALILILASLLPAATSRAAFWGWPERSEQLATLAEAEAVVRELPASKRHGALAAAGSDVGHWTLVNTDGERFTAGDAKELKRGIRTLVPEAASGVARLTIHLTEKTLFRHPAQVSALPADADLVVVLANRTMKVSRLGTRGDRLAVAVGPRLLLEVPDHQLFRETIWQLQRTVRRDAVRTLALEPGGPTSVRRAPRVDPGNRLGRADPIDPGHLDRGLAALSGQFVLASGHIEGQQLAFKPSSGPETRMALSRLVSAAQSADANLIVLSTSSSRQPGTRNWLYQRIEVSTLGRAIERQSLGAFLTALAGDEARILARAGRSVGGRVHLTLSPVPASTTAGSLTDTVTQAVTGTWSDIVSETAGSIAVLGIRASLLSQARQSEIDRRWLAGVPSWLQFGVLGAWIVGLLAFPVLLRWWRRVWPPETSSEYGSRQGYLLALAVRWLCFLVLFVPIAAVPGLVSALLGMVRRRSIAGPEANTV